MCRHVTVKWMENATKRMPNLLMLFPAIFASLAEAENSIHVPAAAWESATTGLFETWVDRRELAVLYHPWEASQAGKFAMISQEVTIPTGWDNGVRLHFYMSDDYDASRVALTEGWLGQIHLVGHRFKQVLINDEVVWEQDVADAVSTTAGLRCNVLIPNSIKAGDTIRVAFRLVDRVGSGERLPNDHRHIGATDNITDQQPWKFWTHVYLGDVILAAAEEEAGAPGTLPSLASVKTIHKAQRPFFSKRDPPAFPVALHVRHAPSGNVPFPVICGIPFPVGAVHQPEHIWLRTLAGKVVATTTSTMNIWPDGSLRWVKLIAILPPHTAEVALGIGPGSAPSPGPLRTDSISLDTNRSGPGLATLRNGAQDVLKISAPLRINGAEVRHELAETETLSSDSLHKEVELRGRLHSKETDFGRYVLRLLTFADFPYIRIAYRIFNDRPETLAVSRHSLHVQWHAGVQPISDPSAPGWLGAVGDRGSLVGVIRHFDQQQPKAISYQDNVFDLGLVDSRDDAPAYQPHEGEAKRHEIWLGLWDTCKNSQELASHAEWMANPAGLFSSEYFCATSALGMAYPHDDHRFAELTAFMDSTYGPMNEDAFYEKGIRHWGDKQYNRDENSWRNGYYDSQQGFAAEYLMTGKPEWFQRLEASVRHIIDIDICHASEEHPDWIGAIHGYYGKDHSTGAPWNPTQRTKGTLAYWRYTSDRDARDAALGVADSAISAERGMGATSVRDHAGILYCLTAAYDETHAPKYLEAARRVAHDAMQRIDTRRGTYVEVHGNDSYRGNVPWMVAQLAEPMYDYYRQSGDLAAAEAVVMLAASILAENRTRNVPGDVHGYSHNPHFNKSSGYHILIAPAILYAYELTGDPEFLHQARAMYQQTIEENSVNSIMNCYWNTPTLLYYLNQTKDVKAD